MIRVQALQVQRILEMQTCNLEGPKKLKQKEQRNNK